MACLAPAALGLPVDRWAFVPVYLFGVAGFDAPVNLWAGLWGLAAYVLPHDGAGHLFANMAALALFGPVVERRCGALSMFALFFIAAAVAALTEGALAQDRLTPLAGASGGVTGLMGAALALGPRLRLCWRFWPTGRTAGFPLAWLLIFDLVGNLALAALSMSELAPLLESVAWRAHLAGFAFGLAAGRLGVAAGRFLPPPRNDDGHIWLTHGFSRVAGWKINGLTAAIWLAAAAALWRGG